MKNEMSAMELLHKLSVEEKAVILERLQNDSWMTLYEVADYLKVSYSKVKEFARQKDFPAVTFGRVKRVKRSALNTWMEQKMSV